MARPAKPIRIQARNNTKKDIGIRQEVEDSLKGKSDKITPPKWLTRNQKQIFNFVVREMEAAGVLGNLDVYVLTNFSVATERMFSIEELINTREAELENKELINARNSYVRDFWRGCNELSLSPQARSKISSLQLAKREENKDPLKRILS